MEALPKARRSDLVITEFENEVLVYDLKTSRAMCLNETAAAIWNKCDGRTSPDDIGRSLAVENNLVQLALGDLNENRLLDAGGVKKANTVTRRKVLMSAAAALAAVPVVLAVVAPTAAQAAASCVASGQTVSISNSSAAGGSQQCANTATNRCCSQSSSNFKFTVNGDGTFNCSVVCGVIIGITVPTGR